MKNECVIVKSKKASTILIWVVAVVLSIGCIVYPFIEVSVLYPSTWDRYHSFSKCFESDVINEIMWSIAIAPVLIALILHLALSKCEITVTDRRVFGRSWFGRRVDLPLDSVSAVASGLLNNITVSTSSGKISFAAIRNRDEIYDAVNDMLMEQQSKPRVETTNVWQEIPQSSADEIEKFKRLLDKGIITQEEFDAKKKQLLGL